MRSTPSFRVQGCESEPFTVCCLQGPGSHDQVILNTASHFQGRSRASHQSYSRVRHPTGSASRTWKCSAHRRWHLCQGLQLSCKGLQYMVHEKGVSPQSHLGSPFSLGAFLPLDWARWLLPMIWSLSELGSIPETPGQCPWCGSQHFVQARTFWGRKKLILPIKGQHKICCPSSRFIISDAHCQSWRVSHLT